MAVTLPSTPLAAQSDLDALAARVAKLEAAQPIPPTPATPSKTGTYITAPGQAAIIDDALNAWTLVATGNQQIACQPKGAAGPTTDTRTANVAKLGIDLVGGARQIVQQNAAGAWWATTAPSSTWTSISQPGPGPTPPSGQFKVVGGQIVDATGAPFRARGVNVNYTQVWGNGGVDIGRVNLACLQRAFPGLNFVRFANWDGILCNPTDPTVQSWIAALTGAGIVVEIELHYTGNAVTGDTTADNWLKSCAAAYKGNPLVWYGTRNEPHGALIAAGMAEQYNVIRSGGATAPVLLACGDPSENSGMAAATFTPMSNVAFDMHYYGWMPSNGITWASILSTLGAFHSADGAIPVLCLETGDSTDGNTRDGNWQQVLQQSLANPAGFACWYMNWNSTGADLLLAAPFDGSALTDYGQLVANAIKSG